MSRPSFSVILVGPREACRADFAARGATQPIAQHRRQATGRLDDDVAALLAIPAAPRSALVLTPAAWLQTVDLPAAATAGLSAKEIGRLMAFEIESLSGLAAGDAAVAVGEDFAEGGGGRRRVVLELPATTVEAITARCAAAGCRLVGISHPAALALGVEATEAAFVEVHDQVTVASGSRRVAELVVAARAGQRPWIAELKRWVRQAEGETIRWCGAVRAEVIEAEVPGANLIDEGALLDARDPEAALVRHARRFATQSSRIPLLRPGSRTRRPATDLVASLLLVVLVAVWMVLESRAELREIRSLEERADAVSADLRRLADLQREKNAADRERGSIEAENEKLSTQIDSTVGALKNRHGSLLRLLDDLAEGITRGVCLTRIDAQPDGSVAIEGVGTSGPAIDALVAAVGKSAASTWVALPPNFESRNSPSGVPCYLFRFVARGVAPGESAAPESGVRR